MIAMKVKRKGHTLIEVIVVIAILVVVTAISVPLAKSMLSSRDNDANADLIQEKWSKNALQGHERRQGDLFPLPGRYQQDQV
jgi:prepilin-type N-terminal cleavage/methylation domain-containing protein